MKFRFSVSFEVKRAPKVHHEEPTPMGDTYTSVERAHHYDGPSIGFPVPDSDPEYWNSGKR